MTGLAVSRPSSRQDWRKVSLSGSSKERAPLPALRCSSRPCMISAAALASLLPLAIFCSFSRRRSTLCRSASSSSVSMVSMSRRGSTLPSTWVMFSSSKQRTTSTMAAHSRILPRNWLPRPSPLLAPRTRPAMSMKSTLAWMVFLGETLAESASTRSSGTATVALLGSMVQKG